MRKLSIIISLTFQFISAFSQSCLPEGIEFTTQGQIDHFQMNFPDCSEIEGDVLIRGYYITNLDSLDVLTSVEGDLEISHNANLQI